MDMLIGNDLIASLIAFGLVLIPAVIVHEFGHFIAAKMVGITILEFGIGYPPRLFKFGRWRETEFTFNIIPIGGFVRPLGEDMIKTLNAEETEKEREALQQRLAEEMQYAAEERADLRARGFTKLQTVNETAPLKRIWFMVAGAVFNIVAALILFIIIGLIGVDQTVGAGFIITDVRPDSLLADAGVRPGDVIETVNGAYVPNTDALLAEIAASDSGEEVLLGLLRFSGPEDTAPESLTVVLPAESITSAVKMTSFGLLVGEILEDSPAATAGLQVGDMVVGLNGVSLEQTQEPFDLLRGINEENAGREIMIDIVRDGERLSLPITPRVNPAPGQGYLGFGFETLTTAPGLGTSFVVSGIRDVQPLPFGEALSYGVGQFRTVVEAIAALPGRLLSGSASPEESRVISIVGISQVGGMLLQRSTESGNPFDILNFIALVNIALGLTNLLPLPPLDGGRILFTVIEMLRGKPLSQRREEAIMIAGMVFLLALGVVVILQDIADPITNMLAR